MIKYAWESAGDAWAERVAEANGERESSDATTTRRACDRTDAEGRQFPQHLRSCFRRDLH